MTTIALPPDVVKRLHALFTRAHYSAAGYVLDAQPFTVSGDEETLASIGRMSDDDDRHAQLLARLILHFDLVPEAGVFPWWHRDLNYLSVPYLVNFVLESGEKDLGLYDAALAEVPLGLRLVHTTLRAIREQRAVRLEALRPVVAAAREREALRYAEEAAAVAKVRTDRLAGEKTAAENARKAAQDGRKLSAAAQALGLDDPAEDGISAKEKARRTMMLKRAQKKAEAEQAAAAGDPTAGLPDPNEPGISAKEKAKRTMMIKRAGKKAAADPTAGLPDPNEPGISAKEKAKRTMMIKRAQKSAPAVAPAAIDPTAGMPDANEPGISAKEKAKRTMMIKRAQKKAAEAAAAAPVSDPAPAPASAQTADPAADPAAGMPDPDEEGISAKERAKRTMMIKRARKQAEEDSSSS